MNESHVIDTWIAELGLSGRRTRHGEAARRAPAEPSRDPRRRNGEGPALPPDRALARRYQAISSPC